MAVARKFIDKNVLMNVIRHTDAHNKIQEEREMWKAYEQRNGSKKQSESPAGRRFDGRMRCDEGVPTSTHCMTELYNFEANDSGRWGHSGYRELYPEDFDGTKKREGKSRKAKIAKDERDRKKKKKGRIKEKLKMKRTRDQESKKKKLKLNSSKRKHSETDSDSESVRTDKKRRKTKHTKRKRKKKDRTDSKSSREMKRSRKEERNH